MIDKILNKFTRTLRKDSDPQTKLAYWEAFIDGMRYSAFIIISIVALSAW